LKPKLAVSLLFTTGIVLLSYFTFAKFLESGRIGTVEAAQSEITQGALRILDKDGGAKSECPLKHTEVNAEISGHLARVTLTQEFHNPLPEKIEAVYVFPLPQNAAVDDMTMLVGDRSVKGRIKRREEARAIYEAAREAGHVASLLDQERPNIFTQSVANITPGATVKVTISYVENLIYSDGSYEFVFPMVVGPRYIPGTPAGKSGAHSGGGWAPDTSQVPDASRITPKVSLPETRAGHDISLAVTLDAGVPIDSFNTATHDADVERPDGRRAVIRLKNRATIPNKDFILKFDVAGRKIEDAILTHRSRQGGFFTMILQPPERVDAKDIAPKELVFVLDTSGSMQGFPIEKAKETMKLALEGLYPLDTFNLITFSGDTHILFPEPVPATQENMRMAQDFLTSRQGGGGTEMMKAIRAALEPSDQQHHVRIVCFMTDGYVGNDFEIIGEIQKHPNARVFSFGIGQSVNRFLLENMAKHGRGEVEYVTLQDDGSAAARRFHERVRNPLLTDISIDWGGLPVADVYPQRIPDLFGAKPVVLSGRFTAGARGSIRLRGKLAGQEFIREIPVALPETQPQHDVLSTLWARARIDDLTSKDFRGMQYGNMAGELSEAITQLGLEYRLMTQFTSFVAVEEMVVTEGGRPRRIDVPVEMPEGVSYEGVFGRDEESKKGRGNLQTLQSLQPAPKVVFNRMETSQTAQSEKSRERIDRRGKAAGVGGSGVGSGNGGSAPGVAGGIGRGASPRASMPSPASIPPSPEELKRQRLLAKLHPSIVAVIERLKNKHSRQSAGEAKFVRDGKAEIQIWLGDKSKETIAEIKRLGFEVILDPQSSKLIIGRLPIEKLAALADMSSVKYVAPQTK
jgi:Ca-activated chloride channel homolog